MEELCANCGGGGWILRNGQEQRCPHCGGKGIEPEQVPDLEELPFYREPEEFYMADKAYVVTLTRVVRETLTLTVEAPSALDARFKAGAEVGKEHTPAPYWMREIGPARVGSVELAKPEPADPMAIPAEPKRTAP